MQCGAMFVGAERPPECFEAPRQSRPSACFLLGSCARTAECASPSRRPKLRTKRENTPAQPGMRTKSVVASTKYFARREAVPALWKVHESLWKKQSMVVAVIRLARIGHPPPASASVLISRYSRASTPALWSGLIRGRMGRPAVARLSSPAHSLIARWRRPASAVGSPPPGAVRRHPVALRSADRSPRARRPRARAPCHGARRARLGRRPARP